MPEPRYPYLHVGVSREDAELACDALWAEGALGIEERDAATLVKAEPGPPVMLVAAFADDAGARAAADVLSRRWPTRLTHVVGDAWRDGWKAYFKPTRIGRRTVVVPSWEQYAARRGDVVLRMDPGAAFGTGTHETTRLVLVELEARVRRGRPVLDVGCGSGILGIAALKLGASRVRAVDVDPVAVAVARDNARDNGVASRMRIDALPLSRVRGRFPLVLANIETRVLVPMADELAAHVAPRGTLVLSGILAFEQAQVLAAYAGFERVARHKAGEWVCLTLRRGGARGR
jgi:ribosomal protein L11 methyltransferase